MRILLTTTSFQDTPGKHHVLLEQSDHEIIRERGPLTEAQMLETIRTKGPFDGFLHGDDAITRTVIQAALPTLKVLSKYGIGLDSVDVAAATDLRVPQLFTPGVNHTTVAEHTFGLLIALAKHIIPQANSVGGGKWKRITGTELAGKTIGIMGLGRIGKEVAKRALAFEMKVLGFDRTWDSDFARQYNIARCWRAEELISKSDVVSLHMGLSDDNREWFNQERIAMMRKGAYIVNCARGGLVDEEAIADACKGGQLGGYATDVLEVEPMKTPHPFQAVPNIIVTPHVGSRTFESVERQALMATENLLRVLAGQSPLAQANSW
jgi:D-3-phosphoglycerate dehydrogenase